MKGIDKYKVNPVVSIRCVSSSFYEVFNPDTNMIVPVNQTGKDIVDFLHNPHTLDEICTHLIDHYHVDSETVKQDSIMFLKEMQPVFIQELKK